MSPGRGRPPSKNPPVKSINMRLTEIDGKRLDYLAEKLKISKAEVLRIGLTQLYLSTVLKEEREDVNE